MSDANRLFFLRIALIAIGLTFIFGIYALGIVWPSGWVWGTGHPHHYLMMIIGVTRPLGCFSFSHRAIPLRTRASSGSPCGRASFMGRSWLPSPSAMGPNAVI